jgi:hypothetical protein
MKDLSIASAFIVSLIFATTAIFFASSASFTAPVASKAGHNNSVVFRHTKYI